MSDPRDQLRQAIREAEVAMSDPQALHAALLEHIAESEWIPASPAAALRAVLKLHKPVPCTYSGCSSPQTHRVCAACGPSINSPCRTVWVISSALGVTTDG